MSNLTIAVWTLVWLGVAFVVYKYVFNPQVILPATLSSVSTCPDRWTFRSAMCYPDYDTHCIPFDPKKLTNLREGCEIAKKCGTNWSGRC